jgi:hypothetical protein
MPDRAYSDSVHSKHLRILQATIRDYKIERKNQRLQGNALMEFEHTKYSRLQQQYHVPKGIRSGKTLMDYSKKSSNVLRQYRCLPICHYYSMALLEDTPGYEKSISKSADREEAPQSERESSRLDRNCAANV